MKLRPASAACPIRSPERDPSDDRRDDKLVGQAARQYAEGFLEGPSTAPKWALEDIEQEQNAQFSPLGPDREVDFTVEDPPSASWHQLAPKQYSEVSFDGCVLDRLVAKNGRSSGWRCLNHGVEVQSGGRRRYHGVAVQCELKDLDRLRPARSERASDFLSADDIQRLYVAKTRANIMGRFFNTMLTINWTSLGLADGQVAEVFQGLQTTLRAWATRKRGLKLNAFAVGWLWVHERGPLAGGLHTHMLIAIDPKWRAPLGRLVSDYLLRRTGVQPVRRSDSTSSSSAAALQASSQTIMMVAPRNRDGVPAAPRDEQSFQARQFRYLAKGVKPDAHLRRVDGSSISVVSWAKLDRVQPQGRIVGKRCGYSAFTLGERPWAEYCARHEIDPTWPEWLLEADAMIDDARQRVLVAK